MHVRTWFLVTAILGSALLAPGPLGASSFAAADADADSIDALYSRAGQLYATQQYQEAIPLFLRVVKLDPRNGNAFALLGGAYFQLGDYSRAIDAFEQALQLDEGIKLAYIGLVASNYLTERVELAQHWLRRMVPILSGDERERYLAMIGDQFPLLDSDG